MSSNRARNHYQVVYVYKTFPTMQHTNRGHGTPTHTSVYKVITRIYWPKKRRAVVKSRQLLVRATHCRQYVILTMTQAEGRLRNATHRHTQAQLMRPCWDISDDIETQTKLSQQRAGLVDGQTCGVRRAVEWTAGMRDSQTEMEVQSKAAEETELVSRQRGEVEGGRVDGGSR